ncbi:glutathione S-transferase family protein [Pseudomonas benzenivorans]|uniref:glutathione transferase n=1 Tax=Pseudomonas benzenivorans TaxID=556533 RepID=A0ABZ0PUW3_9PSED|nr:glutathione S-transferase family protein [Pseudomonas benzenivorans]WPC04447.1 glutathione S-transferase family protein [Pseudomonas benzenivorans]
MNTSLELVSHPLCPYVQRAAIVLAEKGVAFSRRDVDLSDKPAWFLALSPLGKVPLLRSEHGVLFESAVIAEYLDETLAPRLHPADAFERARHRAWIEFASAVLNDIARFYNAADAEQLDAGQQALRRRFEQLEEELDEGPWFAGERFSLVDAAFAPVFRYWQVFERIADFATFAGLDKVERWRQALAGRPSVQAAAPADYAQRLWQFIERRDSRLSCLLRRTTAA